MYKNISLSEMGDRSIAHGNTADQGHARTSTSTEPVFVWRTVKSLWYAVADAVVGVLHSATWQPDNAGMFQG